MPPAVPGRCQSARSLTFQLQAKRQGKESGQPASGDRARLARPSIVIQYPHDFMRVFRPFWLEMLIWRGGSETGLSDNCQVVTMIRSSRKGPDGLTIGGAHWPPRLTGQRSHQCRAHCARREQYRCHLAAVQKRPRSGQTGCCESPAPTCCGRPIKGCVAHGAHCTSGRSTHRSASVRLSSAMWAQISRMSARAKGRRVTRGIYAAVGVVVRQARAVAFKAAASQFSLAPLSSPC